MSSRQGLSGHDDKTISGLGSQGLHPEMYNWEENANQSHLNQQQERQNKGLQSGGAQSQGGACSGVCLILSRLRCGVSFMLQIAKGMVIDNVAQIK